MWLVKIDLKVKYTNINVKKIKLSNPSKMPLVISLIWFVLERPTNHPLMSNGKLRVVISFNGEDIFTELISY